MFTVCSQPRGLRSTPPLAPFLHIEVPFRHLLHHFKGARLSVLIALALHTDEDGWARPDRRHLERETGYSQDIISATLAEMSKLTIGGQRVLLGAPARDAFLLFPTSDEVRHYEAHRPGQGRQARREHCIQPRSSQAPHTHATSPAPENAITTAGAARQTEKTPPARSSTRAQKASTTATARTAEEVAQREAMYEALCTLHCGPGARPSARTESDLWDLADELLAQARTPEDISPRFTTWWTTCNSYGKQGDVPYLSQVRDRIARAIHWYDHERDKPQPRKRGGEYDWAASRPHLSDDEIAELQAKRARGEIKSYHFGSGGDS